jgi:hypothetical protein
MEYVHGKDLVAIPDEIYLPRAQELINKAFRTYVTALKCGVLQGDPQAQNFLLSGDDVTLIDFGSAQKLLGIESRLLEPMIQKAEDETQGEHRSRPLIQKLLEMEPADEDYKTLEKWLLRPQLSETNKLLGPTLTTLLPSIKLDDTIVEQCKAGLCKTRSTLTDRETLSAETIAEKKRNAAHTLRRDMELDDRVKRAEAETYELRMYRENDRKRQRAGGKRRTKYVGNRKRFGTRRKVQNRSF